MIICRDQNAGRSLSIKSGNSSFERVEHLKYFGTTLTNQNSIREEIKSRLNSENACYNLVHNFSSSSFPSQNININDIQNHNFAC